MHGESPAKLLRLLKNTGAIVVAFLVNRGKICIYN
eukprot:XP_001707379.1 Hypothetical protein GL50803_27767 [Giardia lamblia ATCC 50803]